MLQSQEKEKVERKEIEELKKEQDRFTVEKTQLWDDRVPLEQEVSIVYQEVPKISSNRDDE